MREKDALARYVGRIPAPIRTKLLAAFLLIELLLVALGAIGLLAVREVGRRAVDLVSLQHKIDAYRQMQHDTLRQLYVVSSALTAPDNATLSSALRQINQFGYDLDRVAFVAKDEVALLGRLREDHPAHRHRHARARADPRRTDQRGETGPNFGAGLPR